MSMHKDCEFFAHTVQYNPRDDQAIAAIPKIRCPSLISNMQIDSGLTFQNDPGLRIVGVPADAPLNGVREPGDERPDMTSCLVLIRRACAVAVRACVRCTVNLSGWFGVG
jgi:hypothetical protein